VLLLDCSRVIYRRLKTVQSSVIVTLNLAVKLLRIRPYSRQKYHLASLTHIDTRRKRFTNITYCNKTMFNAPNRQKIRFKFYYSSLNCIIYFLWNFIHNIWLTYIPNRFKKSTRDTLSKILRLFPKMCS